MDNNKKADGAISQEGTSPADDVLDGCMGAEDIYAALENLSDGAKEELCFLGLRDGMGQDELITLFDGCSDETLNELVSLNIFGPVLTFEQIIALCSGAEPDGSPNSFGVLSVDTLLEGGETAPYSNISFGMPVITMYASGGCIVVTADFRKDNYFEYRRAYDILDEWFQKKGSEEFGDKLLTLTISPTLINGSLMVLFHNMVFAQGIPLPDGTTRLIMALDGNQTQMVMGTGIRMDELRAEVEEEMLRREEEQRAAELAAMAEKEDNLNEYEEFLKDNYFADSTSMSDDGENPEGETDEDGNKNPWIRTSPDK